MGTTSAAPAGSGRWAGPRRALRALLLAATVLGVGFGLATMHTLLVPGPPPASVATEPGSPAPAHADDAPHTAAPAHHDAGGPATGTTCAHCSDPLGAAMACLAALLLALVVLAAPGLAPPWLHHRARPGLAFRPLARALPRAPALHVLVVRRT